MGGKRIILIKVKEKKKKLIGKKTIYIPTLTINYRDILKHFSQKFKSSLKHLEY